MKIEYNYSSEFGEFLSREGVEELLQKLKKERLEKLGKMQKQFRDAKFYDDRQKIFAKLIKIM